MIVVISRTRGRTPTRGKSNARPLSSGMEISRFHRARFGTFLAHIASPVMRAVRAALNHSMAGLYPGFRFSCDRDTKSARFKFSPAIQVAGHLFSGLSRFKPLQKSERCLTDRFQSSHSFLTVRETQLQSHTGASACPTQDGSHPTQNRVST